MPKLAQVMAMSRHSTQGSQPEPPDLGTEVPVVRRSPLTRSLSEASPFDSAVKPAFVVLDSFGAVMKSPRVQSPAALRFAVERRRFLVARYLLVRGNAQEITQNVETKLQHAAAIEGPRIGDQLDRQAV